MSIKRINGYLSLPEFSKTYGSKIDNDPNSKWAVKISNANFKWKTTEEEPNLKNIDFQIKRKSLVAIVGAVGSGKSSLISAILGEMECIDGKVEINGSLAYCAQEAWIQNATLKNNILFQKDLDKDKYNSVLEACALKSDLDTLPAGDSTEIGEKGINLSGGQKHRVSLARAIYR